MTATTTLSPTCPPWCAERAGGHADDVIAPDGWYYHHADTIKADRVHVQAVHLQSSPALPAQDDDSGIFIDVCCDDCLTPAEARAAAAALLEAAAMIEEATR